MLRVSVALSSIMFACTAMAEAESKSVSMGFEDCNSYRANMFAKIGVPAKDIVTVVNTSDLTITKVYLDDGSVLVSCSRPDRKMVITRSSDTR